MSRNRQPDNESAAAEQPPANPEPAVETIQSGDVHENPPAGEVNPPPPGAEVVHRPLTRANLRDHAAVIAKAVLHLENDLSALGVAEGEEVPAYKDFDSLDEGEKDARVNEAAVFVGNPVLAKPEGTDFRPNVLWAICRALRPKLVTRHRGVTPEV